MRSFRSLTRRLQQVCIQWGWHLHRAVSIDHLQYFFVSITSINRVKTLRKRLTHKDGVPQVIRQGFAGQMALVLAALSLTSALGHGFYNQPQLSVGKLAPQTIQAPVDATVEDKPATEEKRKKARTVAIAVWMLDSTTTDRIRQEVQTALVKGARLRQQVGTVPFADPRLLSEATQKYLRRAEEREWQQILEAAQQSSEQNDSTTLSDPSQWGAMVDLQLHRPRPQIFSKLVEQITQARQQYATTLSAFQTPATQPVYDFSILDIPEPMWQKMQSEVLQTSERMLVQGIPPGLPSSQVERAIALNLDIATPPETREIATKLLLSTLKPNLIKDEERSRLQAEKAAQDVPPELVSVRRGEVIAQAGQPITPQDFLLLDYFQLSRRETHWAGLVGFGVLVGGAVVVFWQLEQRFHPEGLRNRDYWLVWLMTLSTPVMVMLGLPSTNLPAIGLLMSTFYGSVLAVPLVGLLSGLIPMGMTISVSQWLPSAAGGLVAAILGRRMRSREELALLGLAIGLIQGMLYLVIGAASGVVWYGLIGKAILYALLGLAWSIVASGISPYLEHAFDVVTTIRLVELSNPNRPLLKRLAAETPGTFQHTLFVANLAEAAARDLGCHVELVRAGTLYHDIGKMHDPLSFIENQMGGPNKHDLINDPWQSACIIRKHVTEGIVMARKARLPKAVQAFIPEHQGTMAIAYFYHQAQEWAKADPTIRVNEADFRYEGPSPQSRETALVMLADSAEAALRSLKEATPDDALNMLNKILAARWKEGQLDDSGLTREEMSKIAQVFVQVWQQSNHQRIAYPKVGKS
ncbi:HD family phosphohydrolase [Myxacorys almedinensis]|uniref:HDIG domain-containing protein n=1 Tax=Myxacorys almedinensis A TaxID=2690445 RepID=A0A8J8CLC5_9CYAN|nr:HDIG domain-containing metalloprotein [Myxacorys almedinensis]NDJ17615.1 HDIG domain-containing protein [Myxacorys almedinensis A]